MKKPLHVNSPGSAAQLDAGGGCADDPTAKRRRLEAPSYSFNPTGPPLMGLQGFGGFIGGGDSGDGLDAPLALSMAPPPQSAAARQVSVIVFIFVSFSISKCHFRVQSAHQLMWPSCITGGN